MCILALHFDVLCNSSSIIEISLSIYFTSATSVLISLLIFMAPDHLLTGRFHEMF
jgi:hypothetical protein